MSGCVTRDDTCDPSPCADPDADALCACTGPFCSKRRGTPNRAPHSSAATPARLPEVLCFRRAPPFSGDSAPAPAQGWRGGSGQHRDWVGGHANRVWTPPNIGSLSPGHSVSPPLHLGELPVQRHFLPHLTAISPGQMVLVLHTDGIAGSDLHAIGDEKGDPIRAEGPNTLLPR